MPSEMVDHWVVPRGWRDRQGLTTTFIPSTSLPHAVPVGCEETHTSLEAADIIIERSISGKHNHK
jgi:hypothetical protein